MNMEKKRILIAEDYVFTQRLIQSILEKNGYEVVGIANNGREAIGLYKKLKPDLVTMDMNMPEVNGLQAIEQIMAFDPEANIVVVTGYSRIEMKTKKLGAKGFITKPFNESDFVLGLKNILQPNGDGSVLEEAAPQNIWFTEGENNPPVEDCQPEEVQTSEWSAQQDFGSIWNTEPVEESIHMDDDEESVISLSHSFQDEETENEVVLEGIFKTQKEILDTKEESPQLPEKENLLIIEEDGEDDLLGKPPFGIPVKQKTVVLQNIFISPDEEGSVYDKSMLEENDEPTIQHCMEKSDMEEEREETPAAEESFEVSMNDDEQFDLPSLEIEERLRKLSEFEKRGIPSPLDEEESDMFQLTTNKNEPLIVRPPIGSAGGKRKEPDESLLDKEFTWEDYMNMEQEKPEKKSLLRLLNRFFTKNNKKRKVDRYE